MGVSTNIYVMYGVKIDFDQDLNEDHDLVYYDSDTPEIIADAMSGEYMVLGNVLYDSGDFRYGLEGGYPLTEVSITDGYLKNLETKYKETFIKKFPNHKHLVEDVEFKLVMFTHYT